MRIALVAGEVSGDILGAALVTALRQRLPQASFYGVAGPRMVAAGCEAIESIDQLSVMGIAEVLPAIPRILRLRSRLVERFSKDRPDAVIGIDAPDFNLGLERKLKQRGIKTVHFVSPTVWAWREDRIKGVTAAVDLLLCIFPFEPKFYADYAARVPLSKEQAAMKAVYVGHPLADELGEDGDMPAARHKLGLKEKGPVVAILPGSRGSELKFLAEPFAQTARWLHQRMPDVSFVTPVAKPSLKPVMQSAIAAHAADVPWTVVDGHSREAMCAADAVLLASGTATLECLLLGRPMVVAYRAAAFTVWLLREMGMLKVQHVSQPNLLSREAVVPEMLQEDASPQWMGQELYLLLRNPWLQHRQREQFDGVRRELKRNAGVQAADAIAKLLSA